MSCSTDQCQIDLNGPWSFAYSEAGGRYTSATELEQAGLTCYPCRVPGNFELDLQQNGVIADPFYGMNIVGLRKYERTHVWYWRRFTAEAHAGQQPFLVFDGIDCIAEVYLDGQLLGTCENMLVEQRFPLAELSAGEHEVLVHISPAIEAAERHDYPPNLYANRCNYDGLYVRKAPHMYGWDIMPRALSAGLWRPVRVAYRPLERLEQTYLETLSIAEDHRQATLMFTYCTTLTGAATDEYDITLTGICGESTFAETHRLFFSNGHIRFPVDHPALWWPRDCGEAALYRVRVTLRKNGQEIDQREFTHGIRCLALEHSSITDADGAGEFCFTINGRKIFIKGTNWVPADVYHSRDAARLPRMLALAEDIGCNMIRCWGGSVYEDDVFFDFCDAHGILVWQDFAMACAIYPQDEEFCHALAHEVELVVRRLRQHACLALWCGDNECDATYGWSGRQLDPNTNVLTRQVIPGVLQREDPSRIYLPSSPYIDKQAAANGGDRLVPEKHLWGQRDYYKSDFYRQSLCHFVSEIGYHASPPVTSLRKFISPEKLWPYTDNEEWALHATSPIPGAAMYDFRIGFIANEIRETFGVVPESLEDFIFASQAAQAEANKFFIEFFRGSKWRRTGIIWWNLIDGWPQFSDAVVDYYFEKKLAYDVIKRSQADLCLLLREPYELCQELVAVNDTANELPLRYTVRDIDTGETLIAGDGVATANAVTVLGHLPYSNSRQRCYIIRWETPTGVGGNHYLVGNPPFALDDYRRWHAAYTAQLTSPISEALEIDGEMDMPQLARSPKLLDTVTV